MARKPNDSQITNDEARMTKDALKSKAAEDSRSPGPSRALGCGRTREASWTAGVRCRFAILFPALLFLTGCALPGPEGRTDGRCFVVGQDSFAYANELVWRYEVDPVSGKMRHVPQEPKPDYTLHCFVVTRAARQFFDNARFEPAASKLDTNGYRRLIRKVLAQSPRHPLPADEQFIIPGYSNLFEFSRDHEGLLKSECGGAWQSYFQRGHWRMILPLTTAHQRRMAQQLAETIEAGAAPLVHVVRFPSLRINHALLLCACKQTDSGCEFSAYDPNDPEKPIVLTFDSESGRFSMLHNGYFVGGRVDVYEIFHAWNY